MSFFCSYNFDAEQFRRGENVRFFVYTVTDSGAELETLEDDSSSEDVTASHHWILPNREFHGQWEHLIYEDGLKENVSNDTWFRDSSGLMPSILFLSDLAFRPIDYAIRAEEDRHKCDFV